MPARSTRRPRRRLARRGGSCDMRSRSSAGPSSAPRRGSRGAARAARGRRVLRPRAHPGERGRDGLRGLLPDQHLIDAQIDASRVDPESVRLLLGQDERNAGVLELVLSAPNRFPALGEPHGYPLQVGPKTRHDHECSLPELEIAVAESPLPLPELALERLCAQACRAARMASDSATALRRSTSTDRIAKSCAVTGCSGAGGKRGGEDSTPEAHPRIVITAPDRRQCPSPRPSESRSVPASMHRSRSPSRPSRRARKKLSQTAALAAKKGAAEHPQKPPRASNPEFEKAAAGAQKASKKMADGSMDAFRQIGKVAEQEMNRASRAVFRETEKQRAAIENTNRKAGEAFARRTSLVAARALTPYAPLRQRRRCALPARSPAALGSTSARRLRRLTERRPREQDRRAF